MCLDPLRPCKLPAVKNPPSPRRKNFQSSESNKSEVALNSGSPARNMRGFASLKGSSVGMRSIQRWCESFSWSEKSRRTINRIRLGSPVVESLCESESRLDFDLPPDLAFPFAAGFAVAVEDSIGVESDFASGSLRSNLTWSFLSSRNPCFHASIRCRACWAASSLPSKSKIKKECAMPRILAGDALYVKTGRAK